MIYSKYLSLLNRAKNFNPGLQKMLIFSIFSKTRHESKSIGKIKIISHELYKT